jgi:hypothetical protein
MKRPALIWLLIVGLALGFLVLPAAPSYAQHHGRGGVFIGVGPGFWWGPPHPYWWGPPYPYYGYPPPYYYPPAPIIVEQPQGYVQQAPAPPPAPPTDWYYCQSEQGYYPQVQSCPEPWVRVPPRNP